MSAIEHCLQYLPLGDVQHAGLLTVIQLMPASDFEAAPIDYNLLDTAQAEGLATVSEAGVLWALSEGSGNMKQCVPRLYTYRPPRVRPYRLPV